MKLYRQKAQHICIFCRLFVSVFFRFQKIAFNFIAEKVRVSKKLGLDEISRVLISQSRSYDRMGAHLDSLFITQQPQHVARCSQHR